MPHHGLRLYRVVSAGGSVSFPPCHRRYVLKPSSITRRVGNMRLLSTGGDGRYREGSFDREALPRAQTVGTIKPTEAQVEAFNEEHNLGYAGGFRLMCGRKLPLEALQVRFASFGTPVGSEENKPVVLICPSMSNSVFAMDEVREDGSQGEKGWWRQVVGPGDEFGIDTNKFHVITGAPIGSPFGSTSPLTTNPSTGKPWGPTFPQITPQDQARVQALLLDLLGIDNVFAVVGGSMGGMQVLQFAANFPDKYERFVSIAATAHTSPGTVALRSVQRAAVMADDHYMDGFYPPGEGPVKGMAIARMFGTICYRSQDEFDERFDWYPEIDDNCNITFEIERYLRYQAKKFTTVVNYDANCYLLNSKSMDLMDIGAGAGSYEEGASRIPKDKQGLLLSYSTDRLTPAKDLERLSSVLGRNGVKVHFEVLNSRFGHDAFLIEGEAVHLCHRLHAFLETDTSTYGGNGVHNIGNLVKDLYHL